MQKEVEASGVEPKEVEPVDVKPNESICKGAMRKQNGLVEKKEEQTHYDVSLGPLNTTSYVVVVRRELCRC